MFRDVQKATINGFIGIAIHWLVVPALILVLAITYVHPITGLWLVWKGGYSWDDSWLMTSYFLYLIAGLCWLPVVWIQIQLKRLLVHHQETNTPLPERYNTLVKVWCFLGWPAFISLVVIFYLMVAKPI